MPKTMDSSLHHVFLGYVLKKEKLAPFASPRPYSEFILEDLDPFPGFYDHYFLPANEKEFMPRSIFLIVKDMDICKEDVFIRMIMKIRKEHDIKFDAAMAILQLFNKPTPAVRIFMDDYEKLPELLNWFRESGMGIPSKKDVKPFQSLIEVKKIFDLEEISSGIFRDNDQPDTYYLQVSAFLQWDDFERITVVIRNNMEHKIYDAAQAAMYEKSGLIDFVRIFDRGADLETLQLLRLKYEQEINRI